MGTINYYILFSLKKIMRSR